ncbi:MAG: hypothetical protein K1X81_11950 [Bacteroidia bacterium]|nr:hypothetical protein [Bacteroidia bacterium]
MKKIITILALAFALPVMAQEDLMAELDQNKTKEDPRPVYATFKSTRLVNGHTTELISPKHLDFRIAHRFGNLNSGAGEFFGLDQATMRLGFEYGVNSHLMVAVGRSTVNKTIDSYVKYKILAQKKGGMPVTLTYFRSIAAKTAKWTDPTRNNYLTSQLSFCNQLLIARKVNDFLSVQLMPTHIHKNLVTYKKDPNDIFAMGVGGSIKITRSTRFNAEYYPMLNGNSGNVYGNCFSFGFDIETGGHVFQVHFTNSIGLIEQQFIPETTGKWSNGDIRYGFNISRTFSFDRSGKK